MTWYTIADTLTLLLVVRLGETPLPSYHYTA